MNIYFIEYYNQCIYNDSQVSVGQVEDQLIRQMSYGHSKHVTFYDGLIVNGYRFHTKESERNKATMNSGVCVRGSIYGENDLHYYGIIEEILELSYLGSKKSISFALPIV